MGAAPARGHRGGVRKVTSGAQRLPHAGTGCHAVRMPSPRPSESPDASARDNALQGLLHPLSIAGGITWLVVTLSVLDPQALGRGQLTEWLGAFCLLVFFVGYVIGVALPERPQHGSRVVLALLMGVLVVVAEWNLRDGQTPVLLIIVAAIVVAMLPPRSTVLYLVALNAAVAWIWIDRGYSPWRVLLSLSSIGGFQAFAALTGHFAFSREQAREHLAQVNAELLATRRLLEESARAGERLKLSRELHDVAGHSLTALKLNLARLSRDPALAGREEIVLSAQLADDLLAQIRQVVGALRAHDGLDLRAALEALGRPVPGVRIDMDIEDGLRVDDIDQAEALLRCAQEAITNALRHGRARHIRIRLQRDDGGLALTVDNDGLAPARVDEGNGLTGMRERLVALGGRLDIEPTPPRGLRVVARIEDMPGGGQHA